MPALASLQLFADAEPRNGPGQMALDEALLEVAEEPILRVYRWSGEWVSFGYSQSVAAVREGRPGKALVRRWTGGGIVDHDGDWTFALVVPRGDAFAGIRPADSYCEVHRAVMAVLQGCGHEVALAPGAEASRPGACFAGKPAEHDVLDGEGTKICGGAQHRTRAGILHQGSVRYPRLPEDFLRRLASRLSDAWGEYYPSTNLLKRAEELKSRYAAEEWTNRVA